MKTIENIARQYLPVATQHRVTFTPVKKGSSRIVYDRATEMNYKNIFCAKCRKRNASEIICGPGSRFIDGRSPVHKYNVLLDVLHTTKSLVAVSCPLGKVYDVLLEICRGANIANFDMGNFSA